MSVPKFFYPKLALSSIKRHLQLYGPYLCASTTMVSMFYMILFVAENSGLSKMRGSDVLGQLLRFGVVVVGLFAVIFLFYTNSFLVRRRKRELGLYNAFGMEKRHIARILGWETFFIALFSIAAGLGSGILFSKLMLLLLFRILEAPIPFGFEVRLEAVLITVKLFSALYLVLFAFSVWQVRSAQAVELLKAEALGEREPKARWLLALLGCVTLGAGYYIAVVVADPLVALFSFFVAVILVIIGTYLLFTTGSIALLKLLRRSKPLYYRPKPFIAISGMLHRMKQNGVGLANICILSTMVLVTISTTVSLYVGLEDVLRTRYSREIVIRLDSYEPEAVAAVQAGTEAVLSRHGLEAAEKAEYRFLSLTAFRSGERLLTEKEVEPGLTGVRTSLHFTPLEDYNRMVQEPVSLQENEVLVYSNRGIYEHSTLEFLGRSFAVKEKLASLPGDGFSRTQTFASYYVVVRDMQVLEELRRNLTETEGRSAQTSYIRGFDLDTSAEEAAAVYRDLQESLPRKDLIWVESRDEARQEFLAMYGGLFFLGLFLGTLFLLGTVLIIYYKQITEGYEDRRRFSIMQQVGMAGSEVRSAIRGQVLSVFFLPLAAAGVHIIFAFPMITKLLILFNLTNTALFAACTAVTFAVFAVFYACVYLATTKAYYRIAAA